TPYSLRLRSSSQRWTPASFSSGWRMTNAFRESVWRPAIRDSVVDSLRVPGSFTTYVPGSGLSQSSSASFRTSSMTRVTRCSASAWSAMVGAYVTAVRLRRGGVHVGRGGRGGVPAEGLRVPGGGPAHPVGEVRVVREVAQHTRVRGRIVPADEDASVSVTHGHRQPADRGGQHGRAGRLRLYGDQAERLAVGRHDQHRRGPEPVRELFLSDRRTEPHDVGDAQAGGQLLQPLRLCEATAAGAADHGHADPGAQLGTLAEEHGDRAEQHVGGLQGLYAAREERDQRVLR